MIFIAVKFSIRPDVVDQWLARVAPFTAATRAEPGNLFFEWSRSVDSPNQFVLLEAFRDRAAGEAHVHSEHFKVAMAWMPDVVAATPGDYPRRRARRRLGDHGRTATAHGPVTRAAAGTYPAGQPVSPSRVFVLTGCELYNYS
jgi:quinol monooxygenase YgiN